MPGDSEKKRECPRCAKRVIPERLDGDGTVSWKWKCNCGWSGVLTESGPVSRKAVQRLLGNRRDTPR
jgi:hypothetical protein